MRGNSLIDDSSSAMYFGRPWWYQFLLEWLLPVIGTALILSAVALFNSRSILVSVVAVAGCFVWCVWAPLFAYEVKRTLLVLDMIIDQAAFELANQKKDFDWEADGK